MSHKIKVIAISGSTRKTSSNLNLIKGIARLTSDIFEINIFEGLSDIPQFNPDLDLETPPIQVADFRQHLKAADAILICTPEYAMGVPGTLKNAIDWTVSSMEFSKKNRRINHRVIIWRKSACFFIGYTFNYRVKDDSRYTAFNSRY